MPDNEGAPPDPVGLVHGKGSPQKDFWLLSEVTGGARRGQVTRVEFRPILQGRVAQVVRARHS